jgi:DNA-binding MarR family transcriptional regulator
LADDATLKAARYICDTGKVVHDQLIKIQSRNIFSSDEVVFNELSMAQLNAVKTLLDCGKLTMNELAERLAVSPPSASAMVDRLVEKGVFSREHSTQDRRKVVVRISPEAVKAAEEIKSHILQFFVELVEKIGVETAQKWCDVLSSVKAVLAQEPDGSSVLSKNHPTAE